MSGFLDDLKRKFKKFDGMHAAEKAANVKAILSNPMNYKVLTESADIALKWSMELAASAAGPPDGADFDATFAASIRGGPADAARHCFWSARLASKLGYNDAQLVVMSHEISTLTKGDEREKLESVMDVANNAVGLAIGVAKSSASDDDLKKAVLEALRAGKLKVIDPKTGKLVPSTSLVP